MGNKIRNVIKARKEKMLSIKQEMVEDEEIQGKISK